MTARATRTDRPDAGRSRAVPRAAGAVHPLALVILPLPAIVATLLTEGVGIGLAAIAVGLVVAAARGPRFAGGLLVATLLGTFVLWTGFAFAIPAEPAESSAVVTWLPFHPPVDTALVALRGALRIVSIMTLAIAIAAFIRWDVLADTLIDRFRVPYRLLDVIGLGGRFAVLMRRDLATARTLVRLRTRGSRLRSARLGAGLAVPVLMATFRHADELTVAMEARGFGSHDDRTVHAAVPLRVRDGVVVGIVWGVTVFAAVVLEGVPVLVV